MKRLKSRARVCKMRRGLSDQAEVRRRSPAVLQSAANTLKRFCEGFSFRIASFEGF